MERKHPSIVRSASGLQNASNYESSLLEQFLVDEIYHLQEMGLFAQGVRLIKLGSTACKVKNFLNKAIQGNPQIV